jgi:hypothetical protein
VVAPITVTRGTAGAGRREDHAVLHEREEHFGAGARVAPAPLLRGLLVDLVDEQHVAALHDLAELHERVVVDGRFALEHVDAELFGDHVRERRLAEPGRGHEQHVGQRPVLLGTPGRSCAS